jgi:transposase
MSRVSRVLPHLTATEIQEKIAQAPTIRCQQKWWIIYNASVDPRPAAQIAQHTAASLRTVHEVISTYNRLGVAAIETPGRGGRRNNYLSWDEEVAFLEPFMTDAAQGELTTIQRIHNAFEERVGNPVHHSTIYRLLDRHGWRKLMPRPYHPDADKEAQEVFKKTFPHWLQRL